MNTDPCPMNDPEEDYPLDYDDLIELFNETLGDNYGSNTKTTEESTIRYN